MCTWQKPGGAIALRAPTLGQECRQTWLLRKMFRWQCVLSVDLFRTCLHKVMSELIFNFSLHTTHNGVKIILKLLMVQLTKYETDPYFLQIFQSNTSVCLIISVFCKSCEPALCEPKIVQKFCSWCQWG